MVREPAVAGRFYPADPKRLREDVVSYLSPPHKAEPAIGCIAPHAGYMYSGPVAGAVFASIEVPPRVIVLCPNHTGHGHPLAMIKDGRWRSPLGDAEVDSQLAEQLLSSFEALAEDSAAHRSEHAIEVEVPFLQVLNPDVRLVPVAIGTGRLMLLEHLGNAIASVVRNAREPILVVASSDMNHYEDDATTRVKDRKAIDKILALDAVGLHETVIQESISMCGFGPAVAMLTAAKQLGAKKAELIRYATSGDVSGDRDMVVGYAGIAVR
jgi:hypothetical protein